MESSILSCFEENCRKYPDKIAFVDSKRSITFIQMREEARNVSEKLRFLGESPVPVAIYMQKSIEAIITMLGTLYSGHFYSPIDPEMPVSRIALIFDVLSPAVVLTTKELESPAKLLFTDTLVYEDIVSEKTSFSSHNSLSNETQLLYVLFTSGSTGVPKGVMVREHSVLNYMNWLSKTFHFSEDTCIGNQAPLYFDSSVFDIFPSFVFGATVHLCDKSMFTEPLELLNYLGKNKINTIAWVPSVFQFLVKFKAFELVSLDETLKFVAFGGAIMPTKTLNALINYLPSSIFVNLYGPTETTVDCCSHIITEEIPENETVPIGFPIDNVQLWVVDSEGQRITEPGQTGELCVSGACLASGYYKNEDITNEVFVKNPFHETTPQVMYKTGDLVQYHPNGALLYIARKDQQIKYLGHRIELEEIEAACLRIEHIHQCACLYDTQKNRIVLFTDANISKKHIKDQLKLFLPRYMQPHSIVILKELPLNLSGKIDKNKLLEMFHHV